jgi:hypothetical protein
MKRIALTATLAAVALSICSVGSALATPEFYTVGKKSKVQEKNTEKVAFTTKGTEVKMDTGVVMTCTGSTAKGDIEGQSIVKTRITYSGCSAPSYWGSCQKSTREGEIETEDLQATLTEASETRGGAKTVIADFVAEKAERPLAKFTCGPKKEVTIIWTGSLLMEISPIGNESASGALIMREKSAEAEFGCTKQQFLFIEGEGPCVHLEAGNGGWWLVTDESVTYKKAIEIRR